MDSLWTARMLLASQHRMGPATHRTVLIVHWETAHRPIAQLLLNVKSAAKKTLLVGPLQEHLLVSEGRMVMLRLKVQGTLLLRTPRHPRAQVRRQILLVP